MLDKLVNKVGIYMVPVILVTNMGGCSRLEKTISDYYNTLLPREENLNDSVQENNERPSKYKPYQYNQSSVKRILRTIEGINSGKIKVRKTKKGDYFLSSKNQFKINPKSYQKVFRDADINGDGVVQLHEARRLYHSTIKKNAKRKR
ncbi:hypothetical protein HOC13_03810 [Candidatus Woesearchaeota archaeon]|jgi:hypothetical protein|nr:hypothetical protein [Candidatus Woesearchaeota archaeon]